MAETRVLVAGISTRAVAELAVGAGYSVVTLDYYGDRDQKRLVENYSLQRDLGLGFSASALLEASRGLTYSALLYTANLENYPRVVEEMARGRVLLGNTPQTLRRARHWPTLRAFCREEAVPFPATLFRGEEEVARGDRQGSRWLCKREKSGGGHGIHYWAGEKLRRGWYLQEQVQGRPASAAFVADGERCVVVGLSEQLIGEGELGARGFTWCGNILPLSLPGNTRPVLAAVREMAEKLTRRFALRGVNGLDFVLGTDGVPRLLELNPRFTASMELVEAAYGLNAFAAHLQALEGRLPSFSLEERLEQAGPYHGKGILFAERPVTAPETASWLEEGIRDVPFPGDTFTPGQPVCTLLGRGATRQACWESLLAAAAAVRGRLG